MKPLYFYPPFKRPALPKYFYAVAHHSYRFWGLIHHTTVTYHVSYEGALRDSLYRMEKAMSIPVHLLGKSAIPSSAIAIARMQDMQLKRRIANHPLWLAFH